MRIAVPSNDGVGISPHFGRCACFVVFEVEEGRIKSSQVMQNGFTAHARGECDSPEGHSHEHSHAPGHSHHSHAGILEALAGCEAVICQGMGMRAAQDLSANGIQAIPTPFQGTAEEAVLALLAGNLPAGGGFCGCHS